MEINKSEFANNIIINKFKNNNNCFEFTYEELSDILYDAYIKGYRQGVVDTKYELYDKCDQIPIPGLEEF